MSFYSTIQLMKNSFPFQPTSVGPMTDWRGGSTASSGMGGTNRTSAMKAAFQSQFKSSFVRLSISLRSPGF
jgi:hypothetical protein